MNQDIVKGNWKTLTGRIQKSFGKSRQMLQKKVKHFQKSFIQLIEESTAEIEKTTAKAEKKLKR